ncbi:MAG TPA: hypothetical protein VM122_07535 [Usitatibacter sp.]|nr:hypothetical protein [Usitatibacter sp.]
MKTKFTWAALAALVLAVAPAAIAQQPGPIETRLEARKVVAAADGKEGFAAAESAKPGDVIEYIATYRNTSTQAVRNLEATLPIPANTELVAGSAEPVGAKASVDARAFEAMPLKRKVRRGAAEVEEAVPVHEYRSLRWYPGVLAPGKSLAFKARVRVLDDAPATGPPGARR